MTKIGILGCGWLGLPLAKSFITDGYKVRGTTTSKEKLDMLKTEGIVPFLISIHEEGINGNITDFLQDIELLVINIPPKLRGDSTENYVKKIEHLHSAVKESTLKKIIFISSTSVYGTLDGEVTEETVPEPNTASGKQLLVAEHLIHGDKGLLVTIVRFGGLIGPNRHPIHMLAGKKNLSNGNAHVNLIHLNDCIGIIKSIHKYSWWNEIINGVHPNHPSKRNYYTEAAKKRNLQAPDYKEDTIEKGKIVVSKVLQNVKKYTFTTTL